jgi:hypothetical protein
MSSYTGPPGGQPPVPSDHVSIHCLRCNAYGPAVPILPPPHPSLATGHATEYHAECEDCLSARGVIRPANSANFPSTPRTSSSVRASRRTPPRAGELGPPRTLQPDPGVQYPVRPWELVHCSHDSLQSAVRLTLELGNSGGIHVNASVYSACVSSIDGICDAIDVDAATSPPRWCFRIDLLSPFRRDAASRPV